MCVADVVARLSLKKLLLHFKHLKDLLLWVSCRQKNRSEMGSMQLLVPSAFQRELWILAYEVEVPRKVL